MKKKRNIILIVLVLVILAGIGTAVLFKFLGNEDLYTVNEKKYLVDNKSNLITINVLNDANIFGYEGKGVFYDFLKSFEENNALSFNVVPTLSGSEVSGLSLTKSTTMPSNAKLFYTDHYVLVGKEREDKKHLKIASIGDVQGVIGYLAKDSEVVNSGLKEYSLSLKDYPDRFSLLESFKNDEMPYIVVPLIEYLDVILSNTYAIEYHISDMKDYYFLQQNDDEVLSSLLGKYYNKWNLANQENSFNSSEYSLFVDKLKLTQKELDAINSKTYRYGFVNSGPYDIKAGGVYGGTMSIYIKRFSKFSGIEFSYDEYRDFDKLKRGISRGHVDLFMNYYSIDTSMETIESLYRMDISFLMNNNDSRVVNNVNAIKGETVYVQEDSLITSYVKEKLGLNVKTYKNDKELKEIFEGNGIVAMSYSNFMIYGNNDLSISERFRIKSEKTLTFQSNNDAVFNKLFYNYINTIDKNEIVYVGIGDYNKTLMSGTFIYKIAKYSIIIVLALGLVCYISYRVSKKAFVRKKIKRNEKIKYIDLLTSLKNRNYLNENIPIWNQNTIYPQTVIIVDLNCVQELNDTYGYIEGDKQIQSAANALIKTQLDNSEIMRTDGNEFTIYLVGYSEKQVISYIKKLNKEFKNLPHDKGAAVGFSMIEDDVKLVSDAINEATEKMKENKKAQLGDVDEDKN